MSVISYTNFRFFLNLKRKLLCAKFTTTCNSQNLKFKLVDHCQNVISIDKLFESRNKRPYQQVTENKSVFTCHHVPLLLDLIGIW